LKANFINFTAASPDTPFSPAVMTKIFYQVYIYIQKFNLSNSLGIDKYKDRTPCVFEYHNLEGFLIALKDSIALLFCCNIYVYILL